MVSGFELKKKYHHYLCFVVVLVVVNLWCGGLAEPQVPCYFIFGDSLVDNGNNNNIASLARANYMPYGIDFPDGPTGRFSNGKTTVDVIAELLGFDDYIPPYSSASGEAILKGVNYASAAAGIRQETGQQLGARIPFGGQVSNYQNTVSQVVNILGDEDTAANYLSKCIYSVGLGSNDYLNNYFMPNTYSTSRQYTPEQYADVLIQQYSQQLRALYNYGARKFVLIGIGQIGCSPNALSNSEDGSTCVQKINSANQLFNRNLKSLVNELNTNLNDARFMYVNAYDIFQDLIDRPSAFDTLAELVDFIPPYASPRVQDILNADVGIRQVTDQQSGVQITFRGQVSNSEPLARGEPQVPCYFVLGDSTADPGNNNDLVTIAKANYPPYGIDFPQGVATGRFCNGRNIVDIISELLGFDDFIPAYAGIKNNVLKGVNYASGAAGIRDESGIHQGQRISLNAQLVNHKTIVAKIVVLLGSKDAALKYLNKCIYSVGMGSNDYLNNYFLPDYYPTSRLYTPEQYATVLIHQYSTQLKTLYNLGARKVVLIGLGLLGYTPIELLLHSSGDPPTALDINNAVELFNVKLKTLVDDFNQNLTDAKFILINSTAISTISTATTPSYNVTTAACCVVTGTNYTCDANTVPCTDRDGYVYFDNIHPTEIVNKYLGSQYYNASVSSFTYPYDISHLAQL